MCRKCKDFRFRGSYYKEFVNQHRYVLGSPSADHIFRENVTPVFEVFVREILGVRPLSSRRVELSQPKTSEREPDYLREVVLEPGGDPVILHIEFQSKSDPQMDLRMLEYNVLLRRRFRLEVHQYVLLLSGTGSDMQTELRGKGLFYSYELVRMCDLDYGSLIDSGVPEIIITAILTDFGDAEVGGVIRRLLVALRRQVPDERELQKYLTQLELLSNISSRTQELDKEIDTMAFTIDLEKDIKYKKGEAVGLEKGERLGLEKGERLGLEKQQRFTVLHMKGLGYDSESIARLTGIAKARVEALLRGETDTD